MNRRRKHNADKEYDSPAAWADDKEKEVSVKEAVQESLAQIADLDETLAVL